jgi:outer membrane protein TolC
MWDLKARGKAEAAAGAKAWMPPEMGLGGNDLPYGGMASDMAPGDPAFMLTVRQMVPGPGKSGAKRAYLASRADADRARGDWMRAQLLADAKARYASLSAVARRLSVLREAEAVMGFMLETAESRFKLRRADMATVYEARARLGELQAMRTAEEAMGAEARSALAYLMAAPGSTSFAADTSLDFGGDPDTSRAAVVAARGDVRAAERDLVSMGLELESMRRSARPDFGIEFGHMDMFGMGRRFSVMAMMTLPGAPWSRGMIRAETASMRHEIESMRAEREGKILMAGRMAQETLLMLRSEKTQYARLQGEVAPAYRKAMDAATAAFQEGPGDLFRVLDAWDRWLMARMRAWDHWEKALALEAEYVRETGRL